MDEVLIEAAQILDKVGWCQGTLRNDDGAVCAMGAVGKVTIERNTGNDALIPETYIEAIKRMHRQLKDGFQSVAACGIEHEYTNLECLQCLEENIAYWNDHKERTVQEVQKLLMEAAENG